MQGVFEQNTIAKLVINRTNEQFGERIGLFSKLFGCWHKQISRPFTVGKASYRACLSCGARKRFDTQTLKTVGAFHYPPLITVDKNWQF